MATPTLPPVTALGDFLRSARERRGITLQQIANETRIPQRFLDAIEHGDFGALPSGVYRRAEVRAYARAVGLDPDVALARLEPAIGAVETETEARRIPWEAEPVISTSRILLTAAALGLLALAWVAFGGRSTAEREGAVSGVAVADAPAAAQQAETQPAGVQTTAGSTGNLPVAEPARTSADAAPPAGVSPSAPFSAELQVTSDPPGARVTVDGIGHGFTPVTIRLHQPGTRRIRLVKEGFTSEERVIPIRPDQTLETVHVPLSPRGTSPGLPTVR